MIRLETVQRDEHLITSTLRTINEPERKMIQKNVRTAYNENHQTIMKSNQ